MINLSQLSGNNQIFQSKFDTNFNLSTFGITTDTSSMTNGNKISKLADKIRRDVKEMALLCAANDKEKLLNVLIINQQLNVIDPPVVVQLTQNLNESPTIKTILKPPIMPQRLNPKAKRNIKVGYGVVTADEVIQQLEEREIADAEQEIEREEDEISKNERIKNIDEIDKQFQETRKLLTRLRSEHAAKSKAGGPRKKAKKRGCDDDLSFNEETKLAREQEINETNERVKELRTQLQALRADHVTKNKAVAVKRKKFVALKKEKGNLVMPSSEPWNDNRDK